MEPTMENIRNTVFRLPIKERAHLAELLISSLEDFDDPYECERAWILEARKRCRDFSEGKIEAVPADKVFEEAFERIGRVDIGKTESDSLCSKFSGAFPLCAQRTPEADD